MSETLATDKSPQETDHADGQIFLLWTVIQLDQSRHWWINLSDSQYVVGQLWTAVTEISFFCTEMTYTGRPTGNG